MHTLKTNPPRLFQPRLSLMLTADNNNKATAVRALQVTTVRVRTLIAHEPTSQKPDERYSNDGNTPARWRSRSPNDDWPCERSSIGPVPGTAVAHDCDDSISKAKETRPVGIGSLLCTWFLFARRDAAMENPRGCKEPLLFTSLNSKDLV